MNNGFTLVEMLVTVTVFSLIVGTSTGIFVSAVKIQRYNLATQELFNQTGYALEYMDRFLRMARKDDIAIGIPTCLSGDKVNYENPDSGAGPDLSKIRFLNYNGDCQEFFLQYNATADVNQLMVDFNPAMAFDELALTSEKFDVTSLKFEIAGAEQPPAPPGDTLQPRVTIFMEIEAKSPSQPKPKLTVQTTISQRTLDLEE